MAGPLWEVSLIAKGIFHAGSCNQVILLPIKKTNWRYMFIIVFMFIIVVWCHNLATQFIEHSKVKEE